MKLRDMGPFLKSFRAKLQDRAQREQIYCTAEYWNSRASLDECNSITMWPNNSLNEYYHHEQITWLERHLGDVNGLLILDVGCGIGRLSRAFAERGATVHGIDFAAAAIDVARKLTIGDNPSYAVQSVFELEDRAQYDVVLVWGVLTFACKDRDNLRDALSRIHQVLKPNGKLLMMEPIHSGFLHRVLNMDVRSFLSVMSDTGFSVKEVSQMHFWPARLALAFIPWPRIITASGYHIGQSVMKVLGNRILGDYKAVCAIS